MPNRQALLAALFTAVIAPFSAAAADPEPAAPTASAEATREVTVKVLAPWEGKVST